MQFSRKYNSEYEQLQTLDKNFEKHYEDNDDKKTYLNNYLEIRNKINLENVSKLRKVYKNTSEHFTDDEQFILMIQTFNDEQF